MTDLLFIDTNVLIYAMDPLEPQKRTRAKAVLEACVRSGALVTSPQTLTECYRVLAERRRFAPPGQARAFVESLAPSCTAPLDWPTIATALAIADRRLYHWWDCLMLAAAVRARCVAFLTEDLNEGDDIDGMVVVNPFLTDLTPYLG